MLTFTGLQGQHPTDIQLNLTNTAGDENLTIQCSQVRYIEGQAPQAIVMAMMSKAFDVSPVLRVRMNVFG